MITVTAAFRSRSAVVRPVNGRARHWKRPEPVDDACRQILREADGGLGCAEHRCLDEDPWKKEVDIRDVGSPGDRSAEHIGEEQQEDDRLHRREEQQLGQTHDPQQISLHHHERVADLQGCAL